MCGAVSPVLAGRLDGRLEQFVSVHEQKGGTVATDMIAREGVRLRGPVTAPLVPVIIEPETSRLPSSFSRNVFQTVGATLDATSRSYMRVLAPVSAIRRLATIQGVNTVRLPFPVHEAHGTGSNISESVELTGAEDFHQLNTTGAGVRVAIVDLGFINLTNAKNAGEIPSSAIEYDFTGQGIQTYTNHGTGVAEHVADMAPGAQLYLLKVADEVDLQNAAAYIRNNNIQVANLSLAWTNTSYYDGSGPISTVINDSVNTDNVFWTVAAGNYARRHWRGGWVDSNSNNVLEFSGTDELLALQGSSATISVYMNWNQYNVTQISNRTDINLYLKDNAGVVVASSTLDNRFNPPYEGLTATYSSSSAPYSVEVRYVRGPTAGLDVTLFSTNHDIEYRIPAASVADPACTASALTVAAINKVNWQLANPSPSSYSSQGPTTNNIAKPDIAAPDCTRSLTYGAQSCGTSFASPTMAGAAALVLEGNPGLTPTELKARLEAMTIPPVTP